MGLRGFTRQMQRHGGWFTRIAIGDQGTTPVSPPFHIKPTSAPSGTAAKGDMYVDTNGVLYSHNGTNFVVGGGGSLIIPVLIRAAADHISQNVFVADRAYQLVSESEAHTVASTSGTLTLRKCTGTQAPSAGVNMLTAAISTAGTANTVVSGTLSSTAADTKLAIGDRIALETGGTVTNIAGAAVSLILRPI